MDEHRAECEAAGMDGFITKPLRTTALPELQRRAREYQRATAALTGDCDV
jgi:CheY-like chemotaxis protein